MRYLPLIIILALAGCGQTQQGDAIRAAVAERGAEAYDKGLENAEWFICQAASIGSVRRRYADNDAKAKAYSELCRDAPSEPILDQ